MKRLIFISLILLSWASVADERLYELRVDGLVCAYCAYGIEKKLKSIDGVSPSSIEVKLNEGLVKFKADTVKPITRPLLEGLVADSGFTLRKFKVKNTTPQNQ